MNNPKKTPEEYLSMYVVNIETGCFLYTGLCNDFGYGRARFYGKPMGAHRLSYIYNVGPVPNGLFVLHKCDVPQCINPNHLYIGTKKDNIHDCVKRGRHFTPALSGEKSGASKISDKQRNEIRNSSKTKKELSKEYGISLSQIYKIFNNRLYKSRKKVLL